MCGWKLGGSVVAVLCPSFFSLFPSLLSSVYLILSVTLCFSWEYTCSNVDAHPRENCGRSDHQPRSEKGLQMHNELEGEKNVHKY